MELNENKINAEREIRNSGLHPNVVDYLIETSVAVNTLYTPFNEKEFIKKVSDHQPERIRQIWYAYEAPWFSREWEYYSRSGLDLNEWRDSTVLTNPGVYGVSRHPDGSIGLLLFVRWQVIESINWRTRIDHWNRYLNGIFAQYRRLVHHIIQEWRPDPELLAMVGILPGVAIKRRESFPEYQDIIKMCEQKNLNSWRFINTAVWRILKKEGLSEENLIILGSGWTLGKAVAQFFQKATLIDTNNKDDMPRSGKWVIVDCTTGWSMEEYLPRLSNNAQWTWVNEAYPPPNKTLTLKAIENWMESFHINWVDGEIIPPYPDGYGSTPPCCIWLLDQDAETVVVSRWPAERAIMHNEFELSR